MKEDDVVSWLCDQASALLQNPSDMGTIEKAVDRVSLQCRRRALQCLVQQQADRQELNCPRCGAALLVQANHRPSPRRCPPPDRDRSGPFHPPPRSAPTGTTSLGTKGPR